MTEAASRSATTVAPPVTIRPYRPLDHRACRELWAELTHTREARYDNVSVEPDPGAGFREAQFQGRSRVLGVLKKVLNRAVQPFGDDLQRPRRRACPAKFHLVEKRAAEVLLGDTGEAEPQFHPDLADPGA